jgi:hypothetical protein
MFRQNEQSKSAAVIEDIRRPETNVPELEEEGGTDEARRKKWILSQWHGVELTSLRRASKLDPADAGRRNDRAATKAAPWIMDDLLSTRLLFSFAAIRRPTAWLAGQSWKPRRVVVAPLKGLMRGVKAVHSAKLQRRRRRAAEEAIEWSYFPAVFPSRGIGEETSERN